MFHRRKSCQILFRNGLTGFVGVNNSGKSSILKLFYEFRNLFQVFQNRGAWHSALSGGQENFQYGNTVADSAEVFANTNTRDLSIELQFIEQNRPTEIDGAITPDKLIINIKRNTNTFTAELYHAENRIQTTTQKIGNIADGTYSIGDRRIDVTDFVDLFKGLHNNLYIASFRNVLNLSGESNYFDIKVGKDVAATWRQYKTGDNISLNNLAIKITEDIGKIFEFNDLDIDASDNLQTFKIRIDGKPYRLIDIGSGFVQFLVTLVNIAQKEPFYIMIDEPEQNLHPRLQVDFLTTLGSYAKNGVLFATHNIGLARVCADHIYSVYKVSEGKSKLQVFESTPRLSEFLGELGFSTFRELGFSKVLLVEGATDIKTVQQFLRIYNKDHNIVPLPLGGSDMINANREYELTEIKRITDNISALIDSERASSDEPLAPEREAFVNLCSQVGIDCHVLERRSIENYLTERAIKAFKGDKYEALQPYQRLEDISPAWGKQENWRIAREMTEDEISSTDFGQFLNAL